MMEKFQNKYRIPTNRLAGYDYGSNGLYFVTICTKNKNHYFGNIVETHNCASHNNPTNPEQTHNCASYNNPTNPEETDNCPSLHTTIMGQIAFDYWNEIPKHYPFVDLDEFVIMPNHIHGILFFNRPDKTNWQPNQFGAQSKNLGAVIRAFKSTTKRYANINNIEFEWQPRYHDRIIRNEKELNAIRQYIINNPSKWNDDVLNPSTVDTHHCAYHNKPANPVQTDNCPSGNDIESIETQNGVSVNKITKHNVETHNSASLHQTIEHETENLLKEIVG